MEYFFEELIITLTHFCLIGLASLVIGQAWAKLDKYIEKQEIK